MNRRLWLIKAIMKRIANNNNTKENSNIFKILVYFIKYENKKWKREENKSVDVN